MQWPISHGVFASLRLLLFAYWSVILIVSYMETEDGRFFFTYLSHLHQIPILLYLFAATMCSFLDRAASNDLIVALRAENFNAKSRKNGGK